MPQGVLVKLHVAVLFPTQTAGITLRILGRQADCLTASANTSSPVMPAMVPHAFVEGAPGQIRRASNALKGVLGSCLAHETLHCASLGVLQRVSVKCFVAARVPTALALVRSHIQRAVAALRALNANSFAPVE